jgi:hypothetical protein
MERDGVVIKRDELKDWVNSLLVVEKNKPFDFAWTHVTLISTLNVSTS